MFAEVKPGVDSLFTPPFEHLLKDKKIGLITNHTGINSEGISTIDCLKKQSTRLKYNLVALFAPEHGLSGVLYAGELVPKDFNGIPIYSLHGTTRRPTKEMLNGINLLIYDIQDLGSRSYTYISTLFYAMEEAAKAGIPLIVLDRPNPLGGLLVDGPMLDEKWRSFLGYINVPYCHGLTIGELAAYFNAEYGVKCHLTVVPMEGWRREMTFRETGLTWIPTSPNIPEADTPFYYPITGPLGELQLLNIGVGYSLPFKVIGAPWIHAEQFAQKLNEQKYPGVHFQPFHYRPFFGRFSGETCHGVLIVITDPKNYLPVSTQYLLIGILKILYPVEFKEAIKQSVDRIEPFNKVNGTDEVYRMIRDEPYVTWKLRSIHRKRRADYMEKRRAFFLY